LISLLYLKWKFKGQNVFYFLLLLILYVIFDILLQISDENLNIYVSFIQFKLFQTSVTFIAVFIILISKIFNFQTNLLVFWKFQLNFVKYFSNKALFERVLLFFELLRAKTVEFFTLKLVIFFHCNENHLILSILFFWF
jgi:hypothetical protein